MHEPGVIEALDDSIELTERPPAPGRGRTLLTLGLVATLVAALAFVVSSREKPGPPSPAERLAAVQAQVAAADSVQVEGTERWTTEVTKDGVVTPAEADPSEIRFSSEVDLPGDFHATYESEHRHLEMVLDDGLLSTRQDDKHDDLPLGLWVQASFGRGEIADAAPVSIRDGDGVLPLLPPGFTIGPQCGATVPELLSIFRDLKGPGVPEPEQLPDGDLRVRISLQELIGRLAPATDAANLPTSDLTGDVTFDATVSPSGELTRLTLTVDEHHPAVAGESKSVSSQIELGLTGWNSPVSLALPNPADLDPTPDVEEDAIAAIGFSTLAPASVPAPYVLVSATAQAAPADGASCPSVYLRYADPQAELGGGLTRSIDLMQSPVSCTGTTAGSRIATSVDRATAVRAPFVAGDLRGTIIRYDAPEYGASAIVELIVGQVRLEVFSDVAEADLVAALATLGPLQLPAS